MSISALAPGLVQKELATFIRDHSFGTYQGVLEKQTSSLRKSVKMCVCGRKGGGRERGGGGSGFNL